MTLFGEKCSRCGKTRTRGLYEVLPTCESGEALIESKLQAYRENRRRCPIDAAEMDKDVLLNLVIDRCRGTGSPGEVDGSGRIGRRPDRGNPA